MWISQIIEYVDTNHLTGKIWTKTHSFFALMGGFVLCNKDDDITKSSETLSIERLEELEKKGKICWPSISEKEIKDRSKGDFLSKGLVVLQTTWFTVQYISRAIFELSCTELELVALTLAVMNGIVYFFWWNKPLNVACPVPVYLLSSKKEVGTQTSDPEDNDRELNKVQVLATNQIESNSFFGPASPGLSLCALLCKVEGYRVIPIQEGPGMFDGHDLV